MCHSSDYDSCECIICGKPIVEQSVEHVIPEAIGGRKTTKTVCKHCNSLLGAKVDCLLTEDPAIRFLRARFCIPNKDGNIINIISDLKKGQFHDESGNKIVIKDGDGKTLPRHYVGNPTPEVQVYRKNGNQISVNWSAMDFESAFIATKRRLAKEGIEIPEDQLRSIMGTKVNGSWDYVALQTDIISYQENYVPCVIKITYEAMNELFPFYWESDPLGKSYRGYLMSIINGSPPSDTVLPAEVVSNNDFCSTSNCHILIFRKTIEGVFAELYLFGSLHFSVLLSNNPEKYDSLANNTAYYLT